MRDLVSKIKDALALAVAVFTADANGVTIDTQGYGSCAFVANVGASGDTLSGSVKAELEVEESDDGSTWTDVANEDLTHYVTGTNDGCFAVVDDGAEDEAVYRTGYIGNKRYVRAVVNLTGTHTNGIPIGVVARLGNPAFSPTT